MVNGKGSDQIDWAEQITSDVGWWADQVATWVNGLADGRCTSICLSANVKYQWQ